MKDFIVEKLRCETTDNNLLEWWNEYDSDTCGGTQILTSLEEWAEVLGDGPADFACRVYFGDVGNWNDSYFWLNGYGNFQSGVSLTAANSPIDFESLVRWLMEENPDYIEGWINEWEEEHAEAEAEE